MPDLPSPFAKSFRITGCYDVEFAPDGETLAAVGRNLVLWEASRKRRIASCHPLPHLSSLSFTPEGESLIVKNTRGDCVRLNAETLEILGRLGGRDCGEGPGPVALAGGLFVDCSWSGRVRVCSVETGEVVLDERERRHMVSCLATSADRSLFAYMVTDQRAEPFSTELRLRRWPFMSEQPFLVMGIEDSVDALAIDGPDRLAYARYDELVVLSLPDGQRQAVRRIPVGGTGETLVWRPNADELVATGGGRATGYDPDLSILWNVELPYPSSAAFSPDGTTMAIGDWESGIVGTRI